MFSPNQVRQAIYSVLATLPLIEIKGVYNPLRGFQFSGKPLDFVTGLSVIFMFMLRTKTFEQIVDLVEAERVRQTELWPNDAKLSFDAWVAIYDQQLAKYGAALVDEEALSYYSGESSESRLIKMAAVCIAAVEGLFQTAQLGVLKENDSHEALGTPTHEAHQESPTVATATLATTADVNINP